MDSHEIAKPYAEALVSLAGEQNLLQEISQEMSGFFEILKSEKKLSIFLEAPHISSADKKALLQKIFANKFSQTFCNFIYILVEKRRFLIFEEIVEEFSSLMDKEEGRLRAQVITAKEVSESLANKITSTLEKKTKQQIIVEYKVKPNLLGGIVLKIGDIQIDGSLRHGLEDWKKVLLEKKI